VITCSAQNRVVRRLLILVPLITVLAACGGTKHSAQRDWKAVIDDWENNGRIDGQYTCGAADAAAAHLNDIPTLASPAATLRLATGAVDRYARAVCPSTP
jgi:hypothetical protein